jgi:hypothetical protein
MRWDILRVPANLRPVSTALGVAIVAHIADCTELVRLAS